jgi:hypothetical protein
MAMIRYTDINTGNSLLDEGLENYLLHGYMPGGFLTAVICNDLQLACGRADHWNKPRLPEIVNEVFFKLPAQAYGNAERMRAWCRDKDGLRTQYRERKEKEYTWHVLKGEAREAVNEPPF